MIQLIALVARGAAMLIPLEASIKAMGRRLAAAAIVWAIAALFSLAALISLYLLLDRWLTEWLGALAAAGILCAGNLAIVALLLIARALSRRRPRPRDEAARDLAALKPALDAGIGLGRDLNRALRKASPSIALAAAITGLVIGLRPQILGGKRRAPKKQTEK
jgi:hypothetical protein